MDLFKASIGLSVSKCGGLKCLPSCDVGNFCWVNRVGILGLKCLPPFMGVG